MWVPRAPQEFQACLGHLALGDRVSLDHRDPLGHQDLLPSWVQVSAEWYLIPAASVFVLRVAHLGGLADVSV